MGYWEYRQNNSGGSFDVNDRVTTSTIIEADSAEDADERAEAVGIYFDGVSGNMDCECCGDRWYRAYGDGDYATLDDVKAEYNSQIKVYTGMGEYV